MSEKAEEKIKIRGQLAIARVSRNKNIFLPDELERAVQRLNGAQIPIYLEHVEANNAVGSATLFYNPEKFIVEYEGIIVDDKVAELIKSGAIKHVSLGADYERIDQLDGYNIPRNLFFKELSLVAVPGIPEANIEVVEKAQIFDMPVDSEIVLKEKLEIKSEVSAQPSNSPPNTEKKTIEIEIKEKAVPPHETPKADEDREWDADAAIGRIRKWASSDGSGDKEKIDWEKYAQAFAWYDSEDKENFGAYKLPHHDIVDGKFVVVWRGVAAAAAALMGARGGVDIPQSDVEGVKRHLAKHYAQFDRTPPWEEESLAKKEDNIIDKTMSENNMESKEEVKLAEPIKTEVKENLGESKSRYEKIAESMREAITGSEVGTKWVVDVTVLPPELPANLRRFVDFQLTSRGEGQVKWYSLAALSFASLTEGTAPSESSQAVTTITATPAEYGAVQSLSYTQLESATADLAKALEMAFLQAAIAKEDSLILSAVDSDSNVNTLYGGGKNAENALVAGDDITLDLIVNAVKKIMENKVVVNPGDLVLVLHPKQYADLLKDPSIKHALEYGGPEAIREGRIPRLFGVDILVSTAVPTSNNGATPPVPTYHAIMFKKMEAVGLAVARELLIEPFRDTKARKVSYTGSIRAAAAVKIPKACARIITT